MKTTKTLIGILTLTLGLALQVQAQFLYTTNDGTITITGYTGAGGAVTIPSSIDGLPVTSIGDRTFEECMGLTNVTIPDGVTSIGWATFQNCYNLTGVTIPKSLTSVGGYAFAYCLSLPTITLPDGVTDIGQAAFADCNGLTNVAIPHSLASIEEETFISCDSLTCVTIPDNVTSIGVQAFWNSARLTNVVIGCNVTTISPQAFAWCYALTGVFFSGNAPTLLVQDVFDYDTNATIYYLPGTTGWGSTFCGRSTVLLNPPVIQTPPQTQTAEAGSSVDFRIKASSSFPLFCLWYFNGTNLIGSSTNCALLLTNVQFTQAGVYTAVITNVAGAVTSSPAMLQVIAPVERRLVPFARLAGQTGAPLNLDSADSLSPASNWATLASVSLTTTPQYWFDLTMPLPPQRFYRAWQAGAPGVIPSLDLHMIPAITLTGNIGDSLRLDYINQFGSIDAWVTLDAVTLTNTSQLYFDTSSIGQPPRLWRIVQVPPQPSESQWPLPSTINHQPAPASRQGSTVWFTLGPLDKRSP